MRGERIIRRLPTLTAAGETQMAIDQGLLRGSSVTARRYLWSPPTLSLGRFQTWSDPVEPLPFSVVRRPSGGRAVLHGKGFEWSFAVAFPRGILPGRRVDRAYELVSSALADALLMEGVDLEERREEPYRHSSLCFTTSLRHDLRAGTGKIVAVAQVQRACGVLVHGSVLERRPPQHLIQAVELALGEPWRGEGLAGAGVCPSGGALWKNALSALVCRLAASAA